MKKYTSFIFSCFLFLGIAIPSTGQTIVDTRESVLMAGNYAVTGKAFLEKYDNGDLILRLDDDFSTPSGPDVQVHLSNDDTNINGGLFVEDIGTGDGINHFSGAISWNLGNIDIDQYEYIVMRCVAFNLHWAGGSFSESSGGGGGNMDDCVETVVATTNWVAEVSICPTDGDIDVVALLNNLSIGAGDTYAFILTDTDNNIISVVLNDAYNFEGSGPEPIRVYGVSYSGTLNFNIGDPVTSISASGCSILSSTTTFLTINKDDCPEEPMCQETNVATTNWVSEVSVCPDDGASNEVQLLNNLFIDPGVNYAFVFADEDGNIRFLHYENTYDFEGSGDQTDYVYGVSYQGTLSYNVGDAITSITASGCAILSSSELFLTVTKDACAFECIETTTATTDWVSVVDICPDDNMADVIPILNSAFTGGGAHYSFIITDNNGLILEVVTSDTYDFEGSGPNANRVYGVSYDSNLSFTIGQPLSSVSADGCFILSNSDTFLTITKNACAPDVGSISGIIQNSKGEGLSGVQVMLNTGAIEMTGSEGTYTFSNLPLNLPYTITPSKNDGPSNGVSAQDMVIIINHILGTNSFENILQIIASDTNGDNKVSSIDLVSMLNVILGRKTEFTSEKSWRFIPADHIFDMEDPFSFLEKRAVQNLNGDITGNNFTAQKIGDVSGNASTN